MFLSPILTTNLVTTTRKFTTCSKNLFPHSEDVSKFSDNSISVYIKEKKEKIENLRKTYISQSDEDEKRFDYNQYCDRLSKQLNEYSSKEEAEKKLKWRNLR